MEKRNSCIIIIYIVSIRKIYGALIIKVVRIDKTLINILSSDLRYDRFEGFSQVDIKSSLLL